MRSPFDVPEDETVRKNATEVRQMKKTWRRWITGILSAVLLAGTMTPALCVRAQEAVPEVVETTAPEIVDATAPVEGGEVIPEPVEVVPEATEQSSITIDEILEDETFDVLSAAEKLDLSLRVKLYQSNAHEMLPMINEFRTGDEAWYYTDDTMTTKTNVTGLSALQWDYDLERAAVVRAMETLVYMDRIEQHYRPDGRYYNTVFVDENITHNGDPSENLSASNGRLVPEDARAAIEAFKEKNVGYTFQGHRRNMLKSWWNCVGVACVNYGKINVYVQLFANRSMITTNGSSQGDGTRTFDVEIPTARIEFGTEDPAIIMTAGNTKTLDTTVFPTVNRQAVDNSRLELKEYREKVTKTYSVEDTSIATVNGTTLTALKPGTTKLRIHCSWNGITGVAEQDITVKNILPTSIYMTGGDEVEVGKTLQLGTRFEPSNVTVQTVTWKSEDTSIATVDQNGLVKGIKPGRVRISFSYRDGAYSTERGRTITVVASTSSSGSSSGKSGYGWQKSSNGKWWYKKSDGTYPASQWAWIDGAGYYFDAKGYMKIGWLQHRGSWYYLGKDGAMVTGWQKVGKKWYYLDPSSDSYGEMVTGWKQIGSKWYYFTGKGIMKTGWQKSGGKWYYLAGNGAMVKGWKQVGGKWYYFNSKGHMKTGWVKSGGKWYYMDGEGRMIANTSRKIGKKTYRFDAKGECKNP